MHRNERPGSRAGHMDNGVLLFIFPIIGVIAALVIYQNTTGNLPVTLWRNLPDDVRSFSIRAPLLVLAVLGVSVGGSLARERGLRPERDGDRMRIRLTEPGRRIFGVGLLVLAIYMGWAGVAGQGLFWWLVLALAVVLALAGSTLAATGDRIFVEPGAITSERTLFGTVMSSDEHPIPSLVGADVSVEEQTSGGAFGQPLRLSYAVSVDSVKVHTNPSQIRAAALRSALVAAITELGASPGVDDTAETSGDSL